MIEKQTQVASQNDMRSELGRGWRLDALYQESNQRLECDLALREGTLVDRGQHLP